MLVGIWTDHKGSSVHMHVNSFSVTGERNFSTRSPVSKAIGRNPDGLCPTCVCQLFNFASHEFGWCFLYPDETGILAMFRGDLFGVVASAKVTRSHWCFFIAWQILRIKQYAAPVYILTYHLTECLDH